MHIHTISNKAKVTQALTVWHDGENRFFYQNVYILIFKMGKAQICKENVICINIWPFHPHRRGTMTVYMFSQSYWHYCSHNSIKILAMWVILSFIRPTGKSRQIPNFYTVQVFFRYLKHTLGIQKYNWYVWLGLMIHEYFMHSTSSTLRAQTSISVEILMKCQLHKKCKIYPSCTIKTSQSYFGTE